MANQVDVQIVEEGYRNATVRVTGFLDSGNVSLTPVIAVAQFKANDPNYSKLFGFRVDRLQYAVSPPLVVPLYWNSSSPQLIAVVTDSQKLTFEKGLIPNTNLTGYDGSINLNTAGYVAGDFLGFTVVLTLAKLYVV
jgi:hypothetical protein